MFRISSTLGPGGHSLDNKLRSRMALPRPEPWDSVALQLRVGMTLLFIPAGISAIFFNVPLYLIPGWVLLVVGIMVFLNISTRLSGALFLSALGWHLFRDFRGITDGAQAADIFFSVAPFIAAGVIFLVFGGGKKFQPHKKLIVKKWGKMHDD